ncbi:MAG: glycosyl hydrolase [Gemmatimonadales bacterium]
MSRLSRLGVALGALITVLPATRLEAQGRERGATPSVDRLEGLAWRNIGPFRGGRATTAVGVRGQPLRYYMGATGGGIWTTDDAGLSWKPIADGQIAMGSVGSLAVAPSDPNVIYAGMGEAPVRGVSSSFGDGVYRTTDAGKTWTHLGLTDTRTISRVLVHPTNSELVYVAAQGSRWGPSSARGVYRSGDGGANWTKVLYVDSLSGPSDLAMDPTNPRILYAATWDHQRFPWYVRSGGPGSGIWKSTDGGDTWHRLEKGLPALMGKIGVAVSRANPNRVWAIVEAEEGGLYRSDDGGASWTLVNGDRVLHARPWYYMRVEADPANPDVVYVINAPLLRSVDAGKSFTSLPDPHGDNHDLWINPDDPSNMIKADDGGAAVSFTTGTTWSSLDNQPTAQFYRVNTDDRFPYWVYGGQQDNSSVAIASAALGPGIGRTDWHDGPGCESAFVAFDPAAPRYLYGGCYQGLIGELDRELGLERNVMVYPTLGLAEPSDQQKYRWNWNAPIVAAPDDPSVLYHAGNVLFRSSDRGQHWTAISPDLTRNDPSRQGRGGGPITNEGAGGEVYGTISYVAPSPRDAGTIWVGTDDGLVQLTRDGGRSWSNVTPRGLPEALIVSIDASPSDAGTAYLAVSRHKLNDNAPYVFETTDYGRSWSTLVKGFPAGEVLRVVREDPARADLLYAGTETGFWVSYQGGDWQRLQLNLPHVPVTDLQVRRGDLVIATEGRAFWILDDLGPVRELDRGGDAVRLVTPRPAYRTRLGSNGSAPPGYGTNAPSGAIINWFAAALPDSGETVQLEILDEAGTAVRTYSSAKPPEDRQVRRIEPKVGVNRLVWDLRTEPLARLKGVQQAGGPGLGYRVAPGGYRVRLTMGAATLTQPLEVRPDPRTGLTAATAAAQQTALAAIHARVAEVLEAARRLRSVRTQVDGLLGRLPEGAETDTVRVAGKALTAAIDSVEALLINAKAKTFQDVINFRNGLSDQYLDLASAIDGTDEPLTQGMRDRQADLDAAWRALEPRVARVGTELVGGFNALVRAKSVPAVIVEER